MAITGWREFPAFVGGRRAAKAGNWMGGIIGPPRRRGGRPAAAGGSLDDTLAAVAWATQDEG